MKINAILHMLMLGIDMELNISQLSAKIVKFIVIMDHFEVLEIHFVNLPLKDTFR